MSWANWDGGGTATKAAPTMRRRSGFFGGGAPIGPGGGMFGGRERPGDPFAGATVGNVTQNRQAPPPSSFGAYGWWETPGLRFNESGQALNQATGTYQTLQVPPWISNPQEFYGGYRSAAQSGSDYADAYISNAMSAYEAEQENLGQLAAGRNWLTGQMGDVDTAAASWAQDPNRALVMQEMAARASPGYEFFTPTERTASQLPIGQQYALADIYQRGGAAGRGTSQGGDAVASNQALAIQAGTGGMQLRALIDAKEQMLKQQALADLAGTTAQYNAADTAYMNAGNQLAGALAALESGVQFEPTDYSVWPALNDATARAAEEAHFRDEALRIMEDEARFGIQDVGNLLLNSIGSNIPETLLGFLG